ncbi:MAG: restriction endonuclease [Verrucomicrobiales bacterium]
MPHGVFITSGDFDPQVRKEMGKVDNLELMNGLELLQLLRQAPEEGGGNETL